MTQILMIAGALLTFWFSNKPAEGGILGLIRSIFSGGKLDSSSVFETIAKLLVTCKDCSPEERKKVQDAAAVLMQHAIEHLVPKPKDADLRAILAELESIKQQISPAR